MPELEYGWSVDIDRGPDWIFVRLCPPPDVLAETPPLAEELWEVLSRNLSHRLVLEMDDVTLLRSELIGQLVLLHKRVHTAGGVMRLSGVSERNQQVLEMARLGDRFPQYPTRHDAVLGFRPSQPR